MYLQLLLLLTVLSASAPAQAGLLDWFNPQSKTCEVYLLEKKSLLEVGQPVRLEFPGRLSTKKIKAIYLGKNLKNGTLYFYSEQIQPRKGQIIFAMNPNQGLSVYNFEGIEVPSSQLEERSIHFSVDQQQGNSCALHSTNNCILYLAKNFILPAHHKLWDDIHDDVILSRYAPLSADYLKAPENQQELTAMAIKSIEAIPDEQAKKHAKAKMAAWGVNINQTKLREGFLRIDGLNAEVVSTHEAEKIIAHLRGKLPIIIDGPTIKKKVWFSQGPFDGEWQDYTSGYKGSFPGGDSRPHSVLAIGFVKDSRWPLMIDDKKILVIDSGMGAVSIWSLTELLKSNSKLTLISVPKN